MPKQSKEPLYRIEEMGTAGWSLAEDNAHRLTKDQCKKMYDQIMFRSGIAPDRLRIVREQ
jgi:hypothetical protein